MGQQHEGTNSPGQQLTVRHAPPPPAQLAALASAHTNGVNELLVAVINTGTVDAMKVGTVLANNQILDEVLKHTAAYKHAGENVTPAADFNKLSIGSSSEAATALRRLTAGFLEARSLLASKYDEKNIELCDAFQEVNASYALVISTVHQLFDSDDPTYRTALRPEFLKLLSHDPYLLKLTPSFRDLLGATSERATKIALRTFFENFCDNAVEPYVYNQDFSSLIQSILLRELRHVIVEESKLPVEKRLLAPYLAKLFENRMRDELTTAQTDDGRPQPVLESLRRCPGESKQLMRSISNFLMESLGNEGEMILDHKDVISCEVMLSIGCLLPETDLTELLGKRLYQVDDLDPSLVLVFASALKFSLYAGEGQPQVDPKALIEITVKHADALSQPELDRMVGELFIPLSEDFISFVHEKRELWDELPADFRTQCVEQVLVHTILHHKDLEAVDESVATTLLSKQVMDLLLGELKNERSLDPIALRWLILHGAQGSVAEEDSTLILHNTLSDGREAETLGISPDSYERFIIQGGHSALQVLAEVQGQEERLCTQLCSYEPADNTQRAEMVQAFDTRLVKPLRNSLSEYASAVQTRRSSEMESMRAADKIDELAGVGFTLAELETQVPVLRKHLETIVAFVELEMEYAEVLNQKAKKEERLDELSAYSVKELVEMDLANTPQTLRRSIAELEDKADKLLARSFQLPAAVFDELPHFSKSRMSLGELQLMTRSRENHRKTMTSAHGASTSALDEMRNSQKEMSLQRVKIRRLFALVQKGVEAPALKGLNPESLKLSQGDSSDLLGILCRISMTAQLGDLGDSEKSRELRQTLEQQLKEGLRQAFKDPMSKADTSLVLRELASLTARNAPFLLEWDKGDDSLPEFLSTMLHEDVKNSEIAWISHDRGWDESMHGPILAIFGSMIYSKVIPREVKARALPPCYAGVRHWVEREQEAQKIEAELKASPDPAKRDLPERFLTSNDLYEPWTAVLELSQGVSKSKPEIAIQITEHLATEGAIAVTSADLELVRQVFLPFSIALEQCSKNKKSVLSPLPEKALSYRSAVAKRVQELAEATRQQEEEILSAAPEVPTAEGISFDSLKVPNGLALPAPAGGNPNDVKRLENS